MAKRGRKSKKTTEIISKIIEALEAGNTDQAAFEYAGINHSTFYRWINEDKSFAEKVRQARAKAHIGVTSKLIENIKQGREASIIFWLKTRYPQQWCDKHYLDITSKSKVDLNFNNQTTEDLKRELKEIAEKIKEIAPTE